MSTQSLYKEIFNPSATAESSMMNDITLKYPWFSLAHFYLLQQAGKSIPEYETIAAKTALHFSNPFLLNQIMGNDLALVNGAFSERNFVDGNTASPGTDNPLPAAAIAVMDEDSIFTAHINSGEQQHINNEKISPVQDETFISQADDITQELQDISNEKTFIAAEENLAITPDYKDEEQQNSINEKTLPPVQEETIIIPEERADNNNAGQPQEITTQKIIDKEPLLFEPLYASDYFASQGIKLKEEQQPTDRMGKQLKSFTEWLKTMKKVHDQKLPTEQVSIDLSVQHLAEKSNKEEEVLTESMADVYLQQGKTNKAKEIYEKLSLLNPSKNAYFAAKLKQIN